MGLKDFFFISSSLLLAVVCSINYSLIYPFFGDYCKSRGVSIKEYSLVIGLGDGAYVFGFLIFPIYKKFKLRHLHATCFFIALICNLMFGFCHYIPNNSLFVTACLFLRMLARLTLGIVAICGYCIMAHRYSHKTATLLGVLQMSFSLGQSFGPILGGFIYEYKGYFWPFYCLGVMNLSVFLLTVIVFHSDNVKTDEQNNLTMGKLLRQKEIVWAFIQLILLGVTVNFSRALFSNYILNEYKFKAQTIGLVIGMGAIVNSFVGPSTGHFLDNGIYTPNRAANAIWFLVIGYLLVSQSESILLIYRETLSIVGYFTLECGVAVFHMFQVYSIFKHIIHMGYDKNNVVVFIVLSSFMFTGYSSGFMISGFVVGHMYQYLGFGITAYSLSFFAFLMWVGLRLFHKNSPVQVDSGKNKNVETATSSLKEWNGDKVGYETF